MATLMAQAQSFSIFKGKAMPTLSPVLLTGAIADDPRLQPPTTLAVYHGMTRHSRKHGPRQIAVSRWRVVLHVGGERFVSDDLTAYEAWKLWNAIGRRPAPAATAELWRGRRRVSPRRAPAPHAPPLAEWLASLRAELADRRREKRRAERSSA
jgi:hypothetical protein